MRHAYTRSSAPGLLGRLLGRRLVNRADELAALADIPTRAEALVEAAMPLVDRAVPGRRARRSRRRGRLVLACALLIAVGVSVAWVAWRRRRDEEYARLVETPTGPRFTPTASGPPAPSGPTAAPPSQPEDRPAPVGPTGPGAPVPDPVTASTSPPARARTPQGPPLPAAPATSHYLRSHRTQLPPAPGARPTLPR